tara:strand:+ start:56 stop:283 length:228 start_codon:yes stop_codon:yes gene_type:complete
MKGLLGRFSIPSICQVTPQIALRLLNINIIQEDATFCIFWVERNGYKRIISNETGMSEEYNIILKNKLLKINNVT